MTVRAAPLLHLGCELRVMRVLVTGFTARIGDFPLQTGTCGLLVAGAARHRDVLPVEGETGAGVHGATEERREKPADAMTARTVAAIAVCEFALVLICVTIHAAREAQRAVPARNRLRRNVAVLTVDPLVRALQRILRQAMGLATNCFR
jgi:hypothetical protein